MVEGPEPAERVVRLIARLDEAGVVAHCPSCGENAWDWGTDPVAIPQTAPNPDRRGLEVVPFICRTCGFVRLHATRFPAA